MNERTPHEWQTSAILWRKLKERIRGFRANPTTAETLLWQKLRNLRIDGARFRRQHPVGPYVLDFYCWKRKLGIEVDGLIHESRLDQDAARDRYLLSRGVEILRFSNDDVLQSMDSVLNRIRGALRLPSPPGSLWIDR
ncbi:MAG: endonuclease domain-containing protein [Thermoanaerobaculia bacterium]